MRKNFGAKPLLYPQPVFIIAAYDENGVPNAMNAAWGGISEDQEVSVCISAGHKTTKNILASKAFTISMADAGHVAQCDYVGVVSGNKVPDKMEKAGFHTTKSEFVNAPVIAEFPISLDCELVDVIDTEHVYAMVGKIVNAGAEESVIGEDGKVEPGKIQALIFDQFHNGYYVVGEKVGQGWNAGKELVKKAQGK